MRIALHETSLACGMEGMLFSAAFWLAGGL